MIDKKTKKFIEFCDEEEYLKHFDKIFETNTLENIKFDNMKMLKKLYEYFAEELYTPSFRHNELRRKYIEETEKLEATFSEEQQQKFEKCWELYNEMLGETEEQLFMFGYILASELKIELKNMIKIL